MDEIIMKEYFNHSKYCLMNGIYRINFYYPYI